MEDVIGAAKAEFVRAKDRVARALATTPDDKINWSPAPTARTPVQLAAHAADSIPGVMGMLSGQPMPFNDIAAADAAFRQSEKQYTSREQVNKLLEDNSASYIAWLDGLTPAQVGSIVDLPFGKMPMAYAITLLADHLRGHAAQIEYIQTVLGDHDWHM